MMISYAQNREDVMLARAFQGQSTGFYIDVGAADPVVDSVTKHFYDAGWQGINVEPGAGYFDRLCRQRPRDVNLKLAISDFQGHARLYQLSPYLGLSSLSSDVVQQHLTLPDATVSEEQTDVDTLRAICERFVQGPIDFLKIDAEGHEAQVLTGGDWERYRPRIVLVEATSPNTQVLSSAPWEPL